ncbi:MAG: right-handed parallel beta-helix repeat-containing protein [Candidatus Hydrogenedentales bacterium]|jgi:hypothetical protein
MTRNRKKLNTSLTRRGWLHLASGLVAGSALAGEFPMITRPRATSGDTVVEPDWEEKLSVTVGAANADIIGETDKALQAAAEYVARQGGGTVKVLPGLYRLRAPLRLYDHTRLIGSGPDTILMKEASAESALLEDSDWFDQEITLVDATGFEVGDAVCLQATNPDNKGPIVIKRRLIARSGNRFKLDRSLRQNTWKISNTTVSTLFPIVMMEDAVDISVENMCLDGNRDNNGYLDGNYAGCVWAQDCSNITMRNLIARNYNGDALSWQICHDVLVESCEITNNTNLGMHPGSGSQRTMIRNNVFDGNGIGIFFCWGVQYSVAENNKILNSSNCGISIGHRDNENFVRNNEIINSGQTGILFRPERGEGFTATGNLVENNRVVDSGGEGGAAVDFQGVTAGNTLRNNVLIETRDPAQRVGIRFGADSGENILENNTIEGFAKTVEDNRIK